MREPVKADVRIGLILGAILGVRLATVAQNATHRVETARRTISREFATVVDRYLADLGLTETETETAVAWFILKGLSLAEISDTKQTRIGTFKAQCAAI